MINGIDEIAVTNMDGLDTLEEIKICTHYERNGKRVDFPPADLKAFAECKAVYTTYPGWKSDTSAVRRFSDLPVNAQSYLNALADLTGARLAIVSVGPQRDQTFWV